MESESLGQRTRRVIQDARISPRILAAVTKIHFTTIYSIIRDGKANTSYPITVDTLERTLNKIQNLIDSKQLPFDSSTSHDKRTEELSKLLAEAN